MDSGMTNKPTVFPGDFHNQRASGHAKLNHRSPDGRFTSTLTATFASDWLVLPQLDLTPIALSLPPNAPALLTTSGKLNWENNTWSNPYASLRQPYHSTTNNLLFQGNWGYAFTPDLSLSVSAGYNSIDVDEQAVTPMSSYSPAQAGLSGVTGFGRNHVQSLITEPQLTFTRSIGASHFSLLVGSSFQERRQPGIFTPGQWIYQRCAALRPPGGPTPDGRPKFGYSIPLCCAVWADSLRLPQPLAAKSDRPPRCIQSIWAWKAVGTIWGTRSGVDLYARTLPGDSQLWKNTGELWLDRQRSDC